MQKNYQELLQSQKNKLLKALAHLEYSYHKVQSLPEKIEELDEESLETWESFCARFGRVSDIFLSHYIRTAVLMSDPGFSGTLRDFLNQAEKAKIIEDAKTWLAIRELRNIAAHEYSEKETNIFFNRLKTECPRLLAIREKL
jgi:hypothetical protein